jgi:membrane-bound metal-dependent hydrolase YbcI (DUF457 family)
LKGIAHFAVGAAVATFFPEVVQGAAQELSFGPLLGGLAGLLPDTLDFKLVRYFSRLDEQIDPARLTTPAGYPDPQAMAGRIAAAMNRAYQRDKQIRVHLHTVRLGADLWRQYSVAFDRAQNRVVVRVGPVVTTAQVPYPGSAPPELGTGRAQVDVPILPTYDAEFTIDIFSGPTLAFQRGDGGVEVVFLPWHRAWTHSLFMALLVGAVGFLVRPVYGLVMALAVLAHVAVDQMGYMGSVLLFPLSRRRVAGLGWLHSGDAVPNFVAVWVSLAAILLNLDRFSTTPTIPVLPYVLGVMVVPVLLLLGLRVWPNVQMRVWPNMRMRVLPNVHRHVWPNMRMHVGPPAAAAAEALDETDEVDI